MNNLHSVLRAIRIETKGRRDHLSVFREFLGHLDRIGKRAGKSAAADRSATGKRKPARKPKR